MTMPSAQLPLAGRKHALADGELHELQWCGKAILRCDLSDAGTVERLRDTGLTLPDSPNSVASFEHGLAIWLGPDEWLLRANCAPGDPRWQQWYEQLEDRLQQSHTALVDVTDYYTVFELTGKHASDILARGCPLDLTRVAKTANVCAQTRIGNAAVLLLPLHTTDADSGSLDGWSIQVRWSYADYLWRLIERSAASFT